jgi:hypothetical protein
LETETGVRRVVWVPEKLDKEIENVRKAKGYTRSGFYRHGAAMLVQRMKAVTTRREVKLQPWEEIVGTLKTIENGNQTITAVIACTQDLEIALPYQQETQEAKLIQNSRDLLGQKISIIKTDQPDRPIIIKQKEGIPLTKPQFAPKVFGRSYGFIKRWVLFSVMFSSLKNVVCL